MTSEEREKMNELVQKVQEEGPGQVSYTWSSG